MNKEMKIKGLKKVAGESKCLQGYYSGRYLQLNYDRKTGEIWTDEHISLGQNSWTEYHDSNILVCGNICKPVTMQEIRQMVENAIAETDAMAMIAE